PRLHVGGHRLTHDRRDAAHHREHLATADALAVGVAERPRDPGAGRGDGGEPHTLDQTGGDHVPGVGEHQNPPLPMEPPERLRLLALTRPFHRPSWDTQTYRFGAEVLCPLRRSQSRSFAPAALRMTGQFVPRRGRGETAPPFPWGVL